MPWKVWFSFPRIHIEYEDVLCYSWNSLVACHNILKEFYDLVSEIVFCFPDFGLKQKIQYSTESFDFAFCILQALNFVCYIKGKTSVERVRE